MAAAFKITDPPICFQVFGWPEFQCFMKRLGIDTSNTISMKIEFDTPDSLVKITNVVRGRDKVKDSKVYRDQSADWIIIDDPVDPNIVISSKQGDS